MSTIITREGKGSELEWNELDANFTNLNADKIEITAVNDAVLVETTARIAADALLAPKATTYTKTEVDAALSGKASAANNTGVNTGDQTLAGLGGLSASDLAALTVPIKLTDTTLATGSGSGTLLDLAQTWNNAAGNPTAIKLNVTNTASGATSKLMDLQVGGVSQFNVDKTGTIRVPVGSYPATTNLFGTSTNGIGIYSNTVTTMANNAQAAWCSNTLFSILPTSTFCWGNNGVSAPDLYLYRDAANTLAQRNGVNSQTSRIYNTYTDASNYERATLGWTANEFVIGTEAAGTGTKRALSINALTSITGTTASDLPQTGAELITSPTVGWVVTGGTLGTEWTGDNTNGFQHVTGNILPLTYSFVPSAGVSYQVLITSTGVTNGYLAVLMGGISAGIYYGNGVNGYGPTAINGTILNITPTTEYNGKITVSIKQITGNSSPLLSFKNSSGVVQYEARGAAGNLGNSVYLGLNAGARQLPDSGQSIGNVGIGYNVLSKCTSGSTNVGIGTSALSALTTGTGNIAVGANSLSSVTTGGGNIAVGGMSATTTGLSNVTVGGMSANTTGSNNTAFGNATLNGNTTGSNHTALGYRSFIALTSGSNNIGVGYNSGRYAGTTATTLTTANNSMYLGYEAKASANGVTNETVIGYQAVGSGSNTTTIGSSATTLTKVFGTLSINDSLLVSESTNVIAYQNSTNAQTFRLYNTYADASNYVRTSLSSVTYSGATYSVMSAESAGTGAANIGIALSPKGTGAITAQVPDGTVAGGNARGANSVDLQTSRAGNDRVASGQYAIAIGYNNKSAGLGVVSIGYNNSGVGSNCVAIGINNDVSNNPYSVALGASNLASNSSTCIGMNSTASGYASFTLSQFATANKNNQVAFGLSSAGNQLSFLGLLGTTANATPLELLCGGATNARAIIPDSTTWAADIDIVARSTSGTENAYFKRRVLIQKGTTAASTALIGAVQTVGTDIGSTNMLAITTPITLTADTTNGALKLEVTGIAATNIRWVAKVSLVEVGFA